MSSETHVLLPDSSRPIAANAEAVGRAQPDVTMDVTVKLKRESPLPAVVPGAKPLTADEIRERYGVTQETKDAAINAFAKYGLTWEPIPGADDAIRLKGTVGAMEAAFDVQLFDYRTDRGQHRGRTGYIHIPREIEGKVEAVLGLDDRSVVRRRRRPRESAALANAAPHTGILPSRIAALYNFPPDNGTNQTIALLEFGGGFFQSDLDTFCDIAGVPRRTVQAISIDNAPTDLKNDDALEVMLDVDVVVSACPSATVKVYFAGQDEQSWVDAIDQAVNDGPTVISISWGGAEDNPQGWSKGGRTAIDAALQKAALQGITVCVASGDDGSFDQDPDGLAHVDFPASSVNVLAVGGTQFTVSQDGIQNEVAWMDKDGRKSDGGGSSGGGVSQVFKRPDWQNVSVNSVNPHPIDGRVVPDVSALAGSPHYIEYIFNEKIDQWGTSAAAPLWAALICRILSNLAPNLSQGTPLPFLTPLLYQPLPNSNTTVGTQGCNDITVGNNNTAEVGGYSAGSGFDAVTGWGSPKGAALLSALTQVLQATAPGP